jgi:DNA repair exonuclease SbcCD ATPase subunit
LIYFRNIRYKNFLSAGNAFTEISLDGAKTTLIVGKNGAGKSTMLDAITYALFARPFRKITKPQLKNSINKKELLVEIEFKIGSSEYLIRRGQQPNIFEIFQNGVMINQDAANRDYQEVLEKQILKWNYKTFCQVVMLGSASFVPFMQLATGARREVIEDILDLQIFSTMNQLAKDKERNNSTDVKDVEYEMKMVEKQITLQEKHLEELVKDVDALILKLNVKIEDSRSQIEDLNESILENNAERKRLLAEIKDDPSKITTRLGKINAIHSQLNNKLERICEEINFYETNDVCPTCHQDISSDFKHEHVQTKETIMQETRDGLDRLNEEMLNAKARLDEVNAAYEVCSQLNIKNSVAFSSIESLEKAIIINQNEIKALQTKRSGFKGDENGLSKLNKELKKLEAKKIKLLDEKALYGAALILLKDNGIKAKIIKKYVPIINKYINKYLASMDFFISFELDENFNETIKSRFRDDFIYTSFSEGEKGRINLAILFTWRTIAKLRNSASTNLLIFDEIFDGSLDVDGTEEFMKILETAAPESNVFVISHKTDAMLDRFDRVIKFEKIKNFSEIVD